MSTVLEALDALIAEASGECPPCSDGPCAMQPCGYHCKYPYTDDSKMWAENCPACRERLEAKAQYATLAVSHLRRQVAALEGTERRLRAAAEHFMRTDPHYADVMRAWAREAEEALDALQRDIEEA